MLFSTCVFFGIVDEFTFRMPRFCNVSGVAVVSERFVFMHTRRWCEGRKFIVLTFGGCILLYHCHKPVCYHNISSSSDKPETDSLYSPEFGQTRLLDD